MELSHQALTPFARLIAGGALILAIVFDLLFFNQYLGINAPIFTAAFVLAMIVLYARVDVSVLTTRRFQLSAVVLLLASGMLAIRDSNALVFLNLLVCIVGLIGVLQPKKTFAQTLNDFLTPITSIIFPATSLYAAVLSFSKEEAVKKQRQKIFRGVILSLPLIVIFVSLFSAADAIFGESVKRVLNYFDQPEFLLHAGLIVCIAVIILGFFGIALRRQFSGSNQVTSPLLQAQHIRQFPDTEVLVICCILNAVFALFLLSQFGYLFIGDSSVSSIAQSASYIIERNTTYAEHARTGFFQLLVAAGLATAIVIILEKFRRMQAAAAIQLQGRKLEFVSIALLVQVFFVDASALWRLGLYINAYGLTQLRFYSLIGIPVIALIILVLIWVLLKQQCLLFLMQGTLAIFIGTVVLLNIASPEKLIVQYNIAQFEKTGKIDGEYIRQLSFDVVPTVLNANENVRQAIDAPYQGATYQEFADSEYYYPSSVPSLFGLKHSWPSWQYAAWKAQQE